MTLAAGSQREEFRYHYKGSELLPYAERAYLRYLKARGRGPRACRRPSHRHMAVKQNAPELDQCRQDIERYGKIREQCAVWVHQFPPGAGPGSSRSSWVT